MTGPGNGAVVADPLVPVASSVTTLSELAVSAETDDLLRSLRLGVLMPETAVSYLGRNQNCRGRTTAGVEVFVKKIDGSAQNFERAVLFEELVDRSRCEFLRAPRLLGHDSRSGLLVFEGVIDHRTAADLASDGLVDEELSCRMGASLGELHNHPVDDARIGAAESVLPPRDRLREITLRDYTEASAAELEAWNLIQYDRGVHEALDRLRAREEVSGARLIHADIRLDQYLVDQGSVYLTDWEEFRRGDPARDVGGFVGEWLFRAVVGGRGGETDEPDQEHDAHEAVVRRGVAEIVRLRPVVKAFWSGYLGARRGVDPGFASRAVAYAGWHTFERLMATAHVTPRLSATHRAAAGVGRTALENPEKYAAVLGLGGEP